MAIAHAMSAKFKEFFISGRLKVIPLFRYSVFRVLPIPWKDCQHFYKIMEVVGKTLIEFKLR